MQLFEKALHFEPMTIAYSCGRLKSKTKLFDNDESTLVFSLALLWLLLAFDIFKGLN